MPRRTDPNDQRLTVYLDDRAVAGRVQRFTPTGLVAIMDGELPPGERRPFTLHVQGAVISGEISSLAQDERVFRLQFAALSERDRRHLMPFIEDDD